MKESDYNCQEKQENRIHKNFGFNPAKPAIHLHQTSKMTPSFEHQTVADASRFSKPFMEQYQ